MLALTELLHNISLYLEIAEVPRLLITAVQGRVKGDIRFKKDHMLLLSSYLDYFWARSARLGVISQRFKRQRQLKTQSHASSLQTYINSATI